MFTVSVSEQFAAAHQLAELNEGLHGHTYTVLVSIERPGVDGRGIAYDFRDLKRLLRTVIAPLDHCYLNELEPFARRSPTAENIAVYIYEALEPTLAPALASVEVAESDRTRVVYKKDEKPVH